MRFRFAAEYGGIQLESGEVIIPRNETELSVGDRVMVYSSLEAVKELEKLFI